MRKSYLKGTRILILFTLVVWLFTIVAIVGTIKPYFGNFGDKTQNTEKYRTGLDGYAYIKLLAISVFLFINFYGFIEVSFYFEKIYQLVFTIIAISFIIDNKNDFKNIK